MLKYEQLLNIFINKCFEKRLGNKLEKVYNALVEKFSKIEKVSYISSFGQGRKILASLY